MKVPYSLVLAGWMAWLGAVAGAQSAVSTTQAAPMAGITPATASASTTLTVMVGGKTMVLRTGNLAGMSQRTVTVHNGHRNAEETYTGVLLTDVLVKAGEGAVGKPLLHSHVKAEGSDIYWVLYSGIEIEPASHVGDVIVATSLDGKPLDAAGASMLVSPEDRKPRAGSGI